MTAALTPSGPSALASYASGLVLSLAAHAAVAALMLSLLHPRPVADQPTPRSELRVETQSVAQSEARPQAAAGSKAAAASATGALAPQGTVRQSEAKPAALPQTKASPAAMPTASPAQDPRGQDLSATAPQTSPVAAMPPPPPVATLAPQAEHIAAAPAPTATKASVPPAQPVAAAALPSETVVLAEPPAVSAAQVQAPQSVAAVAPVAETVALAAPPPATKASPADGDALPPVSNAARLAAETPSGPTALAAQPTSEPVAAVATTGQTMTATLAWSGSGGAIDPVSLKAIASFMRPGDTGAQADDVHDALTRLLTSAPCSRLQAEFNPDTGALELRGHVPDPAMKAPLLAALQAQLGPGIKVEDAMLILPRPQCGALTGIADIGLPQSQDQLTNPRLIGADAQARTFSYVQGQSMVLDLSAPDYDAYVYVDYFDAAGDVIHLVPNSNVPLKLRPAKSTLHVGAPEAGEPFLTITVGPPFGQEIAAAFAASSPLFDETRPLSEPAAPYLDWLKAKVAEARAKDPTFKGEWVYFMVSTKER